MKTFLAGLSLGILLLTAAPASAQTAGSLSQWTVADMTVALRAVGATINNTSTDDAGNPMIEATAANGLRFTVFGMACDRNTGARRACKGAEFSAIYNMRTVAAANAALEEIDYAAVSYFRDGTNIRVTRYVIFDYGISKENLNVNLRVFINIAKEIGTKI